MRAELALSDRIGSYRVDGQIASGGMGVVYRATHLVLARRAAIKVLHAEMVGSHVATERMLQEARILESIDHPTVVRVYDAGLLADGRPWVAMELLDGQTLADHILVRGRLPPGEAVRIVLAIADALERSHSAGIIHRDVKPENVMLVPGAGEPEVKLIDWGIAHSFCTDRRLTQVDYSPGTPCYMSPEQLHGAGVDGRTDTYALGVVAYEMLAGDPPFDGATALDIAVKTLHDPVPPLPAELDVPVEIEALIGAMLAKAPVGRPALDVVRAAFAGWARQLDDEYAEISLEIEIDPDGDGSCVSGEIILLSRAHAA